MLRKTVLDSTTTLLGLRVKRGVGLEAIDETPVAELVDLTVPGVSEELADIATDALAPTPAEVVTAVGNAVANSESHSLYMDGLVEEGIAAVMSMVNCARNTVSPAIATVVDNVRQHVSCKVTPPNTVAAFTLSPLATAPTIGDLLATFKGGQVNLNTIEDLPTISAEQYTTLLETGNAETNQIVLDYLAGCPDSYLDALVADLIRGTPIDGCPGYLPYTCYQDGRRYVRRSLDSLPALAVAAVILRNLQEHPLSGINVSIDGWNEQITLTLAGLGATFWVLLDDLAAHVASHRLRLPMTLCEGTQAGTGAFPILDRTYDQFLEAGGCPELLFALSISTDYHTGTSDAVLANKDVLLTEWAQYTERYRLRAMGNLDNIIRLAVYGEIGKYLDDVDYTAAGVERDEMWENIKAYAEAVTFTPASLYIAVRHLFAGIIYRDYDTLAVITAMDAHCEEYDCEPRIAAYHATKQYICQWVYGQMTKVKPSGA